MKKNWKRWMAAGTLALIFGLTAGLAACGKTEGSSSSGSGESSGGEQPGGDMTAGIFSAQIDRAEEMYENFSEKSVRTGGLFTLGRAEKSSLAARSALSSSAARESGTLDEIKALVEKYGYNADYKSGMASYVCDIFNYTMALKTVVDTYGEQSLLGEFGFDYESIDFEKEILEEQGMSDHVYTQTDLGKLLTASYAGAQEDTGNVYMMQTHSSRVRGQTGIAAIEYYYRSDDDMGVTTVNSYENNDGEIVRYAYNFFDLSSGFVLTAAFDASENWTSVVMHTGDKNFSFYRSTSSSAITEEEKETVLDYINAERERITAKTKELQEENRQKAEEEGTIFPEDGIFCKPVYDFSVLKSMIGDLLD